MEIDSTVRSGTSHPLPPPSSRLEPSGRREGKESTPYPLSLFLRESERGEGAFGAFLLDLDGTLADSEPWHKRAEVLTFAKLGLKIEPEHLLPFTGMTLGKMLEGVGKTFGFRVLVADFLEVQKPIFQSIIENDIELFPDALRFFDRFSAVRKALVTSSLPYYLEALSAVHPILIDAFELRICGADVEHGKPHPEPFVLAANRLGVAPEDCIAIEDSSNGVSSAKAAGCFTVGVDRESHGHLTHADRVVKSLDELSA